MRRDKTTMAPSMAIRHQGDFACGNGNASCRWNSAFFIMALATVIPDASSRRHLAISSSWTFPGGTRRALQGCIFMEAAQKPVVRWAFKSSSQNKVSNATVMQTNFPLGSSCRKTAVGFFLNPPAFPAAWLFSVNRCASVQCRNRYFHTAP